MEVQVASKITTEDVVNLLRSYRIAVLKIFTNSRLEFDFEAMNIQIVSSVKTIHRIKEGTYTKEDNIENKSKYAHVIAFTEELLERLEANERMVLFYKYIDDVCIRTDSEVAKIIHKETREVTSIRKHALYKLRVQLNFIKTLSQFI